MIAHQRGVSIVAALFLIVVLAALSLFAMRIGAAGDQDTVAVVLQDRAEAAARSGIEYGAYRAVNGNCNSGTPTWTVPLNEGMLVGFTAVVSCIGTQHTHNGAPYWTYLITSTATKGTYGTADYVRRQIVVTYR